MARVLPQQVSARLDGIVSGYESVGSRLDDLTKIAWKNRGVYPASPPGLPGVIALLAKLGESSEEADEEKAAVFCWTLLGKEHSSAGALSRVMSILADGDALPKEPDVKPGRSN